MVVVVVVDAVVVVVVVVVGADDAVSAWQTGATGWWDTSGEIQLQNY